MNNVEKITLQRAISMLKSCNFMFAILDSDGNKHGDLEITHKNRKKRGPLTYPMGTLRNHYLPYIKNMEQDSVAEVPIGEFDIEMIRSSMCAYMSTHWGKGTYTTTLDKENQTIIVHCFKPKQPEFLPF
jgi:hypothetical protein